MKPKIKCAECGKIVPYQGKGRPRTRHVECMTEKQQRDRTYMKRYMPKYYKKSGKRERHNKQMLEYLKRREEAT